MQTTMEHKAKECRKSFTKAHHFSPGTVQGLTFTASTCSQMRWHFFYLSVFQDIFHQFERSDNVVLDGKELAATMVEHGISLADSEVDSTLSILNNHGNAVNSL